MRDQISLAVSSARNLEEVKASLFSLFEFIRYTSSPRIGFVSGILYSDGPHRVEENLKHLAEFSDMCNKCVGFPVFSTVELLYEGLNEQLEEYHLPYEVRRAKLTKFWREVLSSGFVTDIIMTPRWRKSEGARDEYKTAKRSGLTIYYVTEDFRYYSR